MRGKLVDFERFIQNSAGRSVKEKIRQIYKYCKATTYELHTKTAREVFSKRRGDCSGIASAFYVLCKANGIPVKYVIGWRSGRNTSELHTIIRI